MALRVERRISPFANLLRTTIMLAALGACGKGRAQESNPIPPHPTAGSAASQLPTQLNRNPNDIFDIGVPLPQISPAAAPPPASAGGLCGQIQEDFSGGHTRYWYAFGEFELVGTQEALRVKGTASSWSGFGVDTGNGNNGEAFDATGCRFLEFDIRGSFSGKMKVELTDFSGNSFESWFEAIPQNHHMKIRLEAVSGQISKMQWTAQPGTSIDLSIDNIKFTAGEEATPEASSPPVSDADPLMPVTAVDGHRQSGRYLQAVQALGDYFLNNQGNPPNATRRTEINGIAARAAYHLYEDNATHLCNGGATTSETQALFFNFMTLYAALTGNTEGAREAYAYLRYFMMPHDGAESPQLPDSRLGAGDNYPVLMHWMIDLSGEAQARTCPDGTPGSGVFGENTTYNRYDPTPASPPYASVAHNASGQVDLTQRQVGGGRHAASFSSAPDADQWLADGAYWAQRYGLGDAATFLMNLRRGLSEGLTPSDAESYPNTMRFAIFWGEDQAPALAFRGTTYQLYSGYQNPAAWEIFGRHEWAQNMVKFLADAQKKFKRLYRQDGPFMPVFKDGNWGWEGDDPNTHWMGFQYRTFAHLAHYYYLTGDENAKKLLDKFVSWYKRNIRIAEDQVSIPLELENGEQNTGSIRRRGYGPNEFALMAQGLILIAAKVDNAQLRQEAEKLLDFMLTQRAQNGSFPYTDPDPENNGTYGFHNAEAGIAFSLYELLLDN